MITRCACGAVAFYVAIVEGRRVGYCKAHKREAERVQRGLAIALDRYRVDAAAARIDSPQKRLRSWRRRT